MKVYVVVGLMSGLIEDIKAYTKEEDADEYEKKLCETYELPYDREERHDAESENEVHHYELETKEKRATSRQEASHRIIDMVEQAIRKAHPFIDRFANTLEGRTLLHGEVYYDLENSIADMLSR